MDDLPRRAQLNLLTPAERDIMTAVQAVEATGADVRLTDSVVLLQAARDSVADFVDHIDCRRSVIVDVEPRRVELLRLLGCVDAEAFSWLVLALLPSAMLHGAAAQVWPDGTGGFKDNKTIAAIRTAAERYIQEA